MKPWTLIATLLICFIVDGIFRGRITTDPLPGTPVIGNSLVDSAPATALVLNEVSDLDQRWNEIRSIDPIAQLQDAMLESVAIAPDRIPVPAGECALFVLPPSTDPPSTVPILLLQSRDRRKALRVPEESGNIYYREARGVPWVGPIAAAESIGRVARNRDSGLGSTLPFEEIQARLPDGGLVRGYVRPRVWVERIGRLAKRTILELPHWVASWLEAKVFVVRHIALRGNFAGGKTGTDALV